jgi:hypothetical protein
LTRISTDFSPSPEILKGNLHRAWAISAEFDEDLKQTSHCPQRWSISTDSSPSTKILKGNSHRALASSAEVDEDLNRVLTVHRDFEG